MADNSNTQAADAAAKADAAAADEAELQELRALQLAAKKKAAGEVNVIAMSEGQFFGSKGLAKEGTKGTIPLEMFSFAWMKPATKADQAKVDKHFGKKETD